MPNFFRQEKRQPFSYTAIETRRSRPNYTGWAVGVIFLICLLLGAYLIFAR